MSQNFRIKKAFVLAAGMGRRMLPLTENCPKPLLKLNGKAIIDYIIEKLEAYGIEEIIINTHYLPEQFEEHFANKKNVTLVHEREILETAGGIKNALPLLGDEAVFVITGDIFWQEDGNAVLSQVSNAWFNNKDADKYGILLLEPTKTATGYAGTGDFHLSDSGVVEHKGAPENIAPYIYAGVQIIEPKLFLNNDLDKFGKKFPLVEIYKLYNNNFYGIVNNAKWYHVGDPQALENTEAELCKENIKLC